MSYRPIRSTEAGVDDIGDTGAEEASDTPSSALVKNLDAAHDKLMKAHEEYLEALSKGSKGAIAVAGVLHAMHGLMFEREGRFLRDRTMENLLRGLEEGRKDLLEGLKRAAEQASKEEE